MKDTRGEKVFYRVNYALLALMGLSCVLPIVHIVAVSLSSKHAVMSGFVSVWPVAANLESYKALVEGTGVVRAFGNSTVITIVGTSLSMFFTILAAYPLSRSYFYFRRGFTLLIVFTILFSGGTVPTYLVYNALGLVNTYAPIWLHSLVNAFFMLVMKSFFEGIPQEMEEAARIDGSSEWRLILTIMLPLSKPVLATLTLFYGVAFWNNFQHVLIYVHDVSRLNLTVLVRNMIDSARLMHLLNEYAHELIEVITPAGVQAAGVVVLVAPLMVVYPFLQKYFVKGVMIGAIKG